jgi:hypothetical protein
MRRAILHIGTEKTGSTAIQAYGAANRQRLLKAGFRYSEAAGAQNHTKLAAHAQEDGKADDLRAMHDAVGPDKLSEFRRAFEADLAAEIERFPDAVFVFSGEHCHSRLLRQEEVDRLRDLLLRHFERVDVHVYLRRQDRVAVSLYSTFLKNGGTRTAVIDAAQAPRDYYDYRALIGRWSAAFGRERMRVARFVPAALEGGSVVTDFCARTGLPVLGDVGTRANESLLPPHQEFLRRVNDRLPAFVDGRWNPQRGDIQARLAQIGAGPGRRPSRKLAQEFYALFRDGNEAVRRDWFPDLPTLFPEEFDDYPVEGDPVGLVVDEAVDIAVALWKDIQRDLRLARQEARKAMRRARGVAGTHGPKQPGAARVPVRVDKGPARRPGRGPVSTGYQHDDRTIIDYGLWPLGDQLLRGPAPDLDRPYFSALGAAQVFGRFVERPFPALLADGLGLPALNLGMSGAGPDFFLQRPELIEAVNRGRFAVVQLMSGRSVANSRYVPGVNQGVSIERDRPDDPPRFAEFIYREMMERLSPAELAALRAENRERYLGATTALLERITVPTVLLYWSKRPVEYRENLTDLSGYWGDFPHFVDRAVVDALRPHADAYAEVVTERGLPQPLFDREGKPVMMWPEKDFPTVLLREHNHYYPSPEMNEDVAAALLPAARTLLDDAPKKRRAAVRPRDVLVHCHVYKTAGEVVDRSLREPLGDRWMSIDPERIEDVIGEAELLAALEKHDRAVAVSSHQVRFPLDGDDGVRFYPLVMLGHPLLRARSVYDYERAEGRRGTVFTPHAIHANALGFADWVAWCLEAPERAGPIADYQTRMCALTLNGRDPRDWSHPVGPAQYAEAAAQLGRAHVGSVERLAASLRRIETALHPLFPELRLLPFGEDAEREPIAEALARMQDELGPKAYERLCTANAYDLLLYERYASSDAAM